jgi:hypothetical protein
MIPLLRVGGMPPTFQQDRPTSDSDGLGEDSLYCSGRSAGWIKSKNPESEADGGQQNR